MSQNGSNNNEIGRAVIYCKVCGSFVPKKRTYNPSICEACKKFFTRTCKRREQQLACQSGKNDCTIDGRNRRFCTSCRFQKCLAVGMKCRLWSAEDGSDSEEEENNDDNEPLDVEGLGTITNTNTSSKNPIQEGTFSLSLVDNNNVTGKNGKVASSSDKMAASTLETIIMPICCGQNVQQMSDGDGGNIMMVYTSKCNLDQKNRGQVDTMLLPLVHDPILFDGALAENTIRTAAQAITDLHGLEFLPLRHYNGPISDMLTFWNLALHQLFEATSIGFVYGRHLFDSEHVPDNDVNVLITAFLPAMSIIYNMLPGNSGASFIGINDKHMEQFFLFFPGFLGANESMRELGRIVAEWNPTLPEYAIFVAFAIFRLGDVESEQMQRLRRRLLVIFNVYLSQAFGDTRTLEAQLFFKQSFKLLQKSIVRLRQGIEVMASKLAFVHGNVLFSEILLTQPSQTRLGELFPKPVPK